MQIALHACPCKKSTSPSPIHLPSSDLFHPNVRFGTDSAAVLQNECHTWTASKNESLCQTTRQHKFTPLGDRKQPEGLAHGQVNRLQVGVSYTGDSKTEKEPSQPTQID